jgi:hypothetical protein
MNQTWHVAAQGKNDIQKEGKTDTFTQEYAQRGKQNSEYNTPETHNISNASQCSQLLKKNFNFKA